MRRDSITCGCSILLAEPQPMLREKIAGILGRMDQIWCIGQVATALDLARAASTLQPDLILADLKLLDRPGLLPALRRVRPGLRIIGLVDTASSPYRQRAAAFGLDGVCARGDLVSEVAQLIGTIDSGQTTQQP